MPLRLPSDDPNRQPDMIIRHGNVEARIYHINPEAIPIALARTFKEGFKLFKENLAWQETARRLDAQKQKPAAG